MDQPCGEEKITFHMLKLHEWPISFNNLLKKEISEVIMILNSNQCIIL